ncbi:zinc finger protein 79 [Musca domestica]|nr:zinc finger protein 79 [Musca domestica]
MSIINRNNKCRTCLKSGTKLQSISTKPKMMKVDKTYMELINHIAQVEFDTDDEHKMPQGICSICSKKIRDSYTFIKQVRKCNTIFLKSTINIPDDNPLDKLEESFATENVLLDECDDKSIKEEVNPFDDEEMNAPKKEEVDSDSSSSFSNDNFEPMPPDGHDDGDDTDTQEEFIKISDTTTKVNVVTAAPGPLPSSTVPDDDVAIKTEESEQKDEQAAELFPECVLSEKVFSDDDSLSDLDSVKAEDDPTYDPLESKTRKRAPRSETLDEDKNLPVPCEDCDRVFQNANLLKRHKKDTHLPDELKVQCPHCPAKFSRRHNMYTHMRTLHKIEPVIEQKANPKKERNSVKCEHCQKSYCNKYKLMDHIKRKHGPDSNQPKKEKIKQPAKRFLCALCGFTCNSQPNLDVHYRRHTGERPFKCDHCDRRFYRMYDVQMHNLSHTGERPFKCTVCEKAFRRSGKLKIHMRTHTNERPYKCTECEKAFKQSKDLTVHRRIHTGERPYKCNVCESTFIQSNSLRLHQTKTKHSNDPVNPINNNNSAPATTNTLMNNAMNNNSVSSSLLNNTSSTNTGNLSHNTNNNPAPPPPMPNTSAIIHPNIPTTNNAINNTGNITHNTNSNSGDTKYPEMLMNKML